MKFKFDLNSNSFVIYKTDFKRKRISYLKSAVGLNSWHCPADLPARARPAQPSQLEPRPTGFTGAHRVAEPNPPR
jgi:hypothetical protein